MVPTDFTPDKPVGTGPFVFESATAGQQSSFHRNDKYWAGAPKIQTLKVLDFQSMDAVINALRGGQIDIAAQVPYSQVSALKQTQGITLLASKAWYHLTVYMRSDIPPFNDVRVRQALRLIVDRKQVVENAFDGYADVANDIFSRGTPSCSVVDVPQRVQDIAQAKQLLAEANASSLRFQISTANDQPGMLELAQVIQQNAKDAGVTVDINLLDTAGFLAKWTEWPVAIGYDTQLYFDVVANDLLPTGGSNGARWNDPEFNDLAAQLFRTADTTKQCDLQHRMQKIEYERGGAINAAWADVVIAHRDRVKGLVPAKAGYSIYYLGGVTVSD